MLCLGETRSVMSLEQALFDRQRFVLLYGTTPPRATTPAERVQSAAERLAERVGGLPVDGLVVYDVQDETGRTATPRPFPFLPTLEARVYARTLAELTGLDAISYKSIGDQSEQSWPSWLELAREQYGLRFLTPVGLPSSRGERSGIALSRAAQIAAAHPAGFVLGGVAIAERHHPERERSESRRLIQKANDGCSFFISQAVYDAAPTVRLLADYARDCAEQGATPRRVILTFTPCGRPQTMEFLRWLGVSIADETAANILNDPAPLARSIAVCCAMLRTVLGQSFAMEIPLGINVESVSINKEEIGASVELFHCLRAVAEEHGLHVRS